MRDYLSDIPVGNRSKIEEYLAGHDALLNSGKKGVVRYREPLETLSDLTARHLDFSRDTVVIGRAEEIDESRRRALRATLQRFMPWRKGPFSIFGVEVDSEWRSGRKWRRLEDFLPELKGKVIADIGASNGYYMFRMAGHRPDLVLGFEPHLLQHFTFRALNQMAGQVNLRSELLGVEQLGLFEGWFDVVFMMGILYHRISPIAALKESFRALRPGGTLIVESQAIPGEDPVALFPARTYAKVPGTYFIPTAACLENWLIRSGFVDVEIFCRHPMSSREQRRTPWMTFESYADFVDPKDPSLTLEGYPAPWRIFARASRRR